MGLALLPWEKLPAWLIGPLIAAFGIFLMRHATDPDEQIHAITLIGTGTALSIYGVRKLRKKSAPTPDTDL
jgi:hypothetical protein